MKERSGEQGSRLNLLSEYIEELKELESGLNQVIQAGFYTPGLPQRAVDEALQCLTCGFLERVALAAASVCSNDWRVLAAEITPNLAASLCGVVAGLARYCARVAPKEKITLTEKLAAFQLPRPEAFPEADSLRQLIINEADRIIAEALGLAYLEWEKEYKAWKREKRKEEAEAGRRAPRFTEQDCLAGQLRARMIGWQPADLNSWASFVTDLPLFDNYCRLQPGAVVPSSLYDFLLQESRYVPDLNDGVRVNIAPLQKRGLLAADVLAKKDLETAMADRAEWRSDERRWCREGKLPRPGWWGDES